MAMNVTMEKLIIELHCKLAGQSEIENLHRTCASLDTDEDRIKLSLQLMHDNNLIPTLSGKTKNAGTSEKLREEGNKIYTSKQINDLTYFEAMKLYTKSIATAPYPSKELALAYANRSAVLFKVKKFAECIKDIERALNLNLSDTTRSKLEARQLKCVNELKNLSEKNIQVVESELSNLSLIPLQILNSCNSEIPCASNAVDVVYNEHYGRHIVAKRTIKPGEVIAIEKPYGLLLHPDNIYSHCTNCLEISWVNIPCEHCIYAMYCSENCKVEAWNSFHSIECAVLPPLFKYNFDKGKFFALRLTLKALREHGFHELRAEVDEVKKCTDPRIKGFSADKKWHSDNYRSLYSLVTNTEKHSGAHLFALSLAASFTLYVLAARSSIFGNLSDFDPITLCELPDATFIGGLILQHLQIIQNNIHSFTELHGVQLVERGTAAMPFLSLTNHSCTPNICRVSRSEDIVAYALRPIQAGEQILDNYGPHYALTCKQERQKLLLKNYYFQCNCLACQKNWPLRENLETFQTSVKNVADVKRIFEILTPSRFNAYLTGEKSILNTSEAIGNICEAIDILYKLSPGPSKEMSQLTEALKLAYNFNGNCFESPKI